jgi:CheY-like chemotaxis protein
VGAFNDPQMALSSFKPDYYDFMLIDIRMSKINGYELYDKLRNKDSKVLFYNRLRDKLQSFKRTVSINRNGMLC